VRQLREDHGRRVRDRLGRRWLCLLGRRGPCRPALGVRRSALRRRGGAVFELVDRQGQHALHQGVEFVE
jgi:hypothetical protein